MYNHGDSAVVSEVKSSYVHLQLICIVEIDSDSGHHPGMEQRGQDLLSYGVCDEVEV